MIFLYRIHDEPKADRIEELATFVRAVGYEFGHQEKKPDAQRYSKTAQTKLRASPRSISSAPRPCARWPRLFTRPKISGTSACRLNITRTSPRLSAATRTCWRTASWQSHLDGAPDHPQRIYNHLEKMCIAASEQEAKAVDAERESIRYKQVEYMLAQNRPNFRRRQYPASPTGACMLRIKRARRRLDARAHHRQRFL